MAGSQGPVRTGAFAYLEYGYETVAFNTTPTVSDAVFGLEQKISGWTYTNNKITLAQLNSVFPKTYAYGQTQGSLTVDWVMSNPWWLKAVFDNRVFASATPDTSTFSIVDKLVSTFGIEIGIDQQGSPGSDIVRKLGGCIMNSVSIKSSIGELARVSADIAYASDTSSSTLDSTIASETVGLGVDEHIPFTFAHGSLDFPDGTTIAELQDVDLTLNQNSDLLWGHGSNIAVDAFRRLFEITGRFSATYVDQSELNKVYAQTGVNGTTQASEQPSVTLTFDNGEAGNSLRKIVFSGTGVGIADHGTNVEPNEPIFEEINWQVSGMTVVASGDHNTTSPAGDPTD